MADNPPAYQATPPNPYPPTQAPYPTQNTPMYPPTAPSSYPPQQPMYYPNQGQYPPQPPPGAVYNPVSQPPTTTVTISDDTRSDSGDLGEFSEKSVRLGSKLNITDLLHQTTPVFL